MKKVALFSGLLLLGASLSLSSCRKPPPVDPSDPCEGVVCDEGYKCVNGKCVTNRKK